MERFEPIPEPETRPEAADALPVPCTLGGEGITAARLLRESPAIEPEPSVEPELPDVARSQPRRRFNEPSLRRVRRRRWPVPAASRAPSPAVVPCESREEMLS